MCVQVTTKGTGLNPNAKVWQEASAPFSQNAEEATGALDWPQEDHAPSEHLEGKVHINTFHSSTCISVTSASSCQNLYKKLKKFFRRF